MIPTLTTTQSAARPGTPLYDGHTDLVPSPERRSEADLRDEFGPLLWDALSAFTLDPSYLADIVEKANFIEWRQTYVPDEDIADPVIDRLRVRTKTTHDHWLWIGSTNKQDTPVLYHQKVTRPARTWWAEQIGLTGGRTRTCSGLANCVNPAHTYVKLGPKTPKVNIRRAPLDQAEYEEWLTDRYVVDGDHWMWTGHRDHTGPCFYRGGRRMTARMAVHELIKGHRPALNSAGCEARKTCVNPDHTRMVRKVAPVEQVKSDEPPVAIKARPTPPPRPVPKPTRKPDPKPERKTPTPAECMRERTEVDGEHLMWTGAMKQGRAVFEIGPRTYFARRVAWEMAYGKPPPSLTASCNEAKCIAPAHSEPHNGERPTTIADILRQKVEFQDDHWIWNGAMQAGKAIFNLSGKRHGARREAWKSTHGDAVTPAKLTGTCGVERCIAPGHSRNGQAW